MTTPSTGESSRSDGPPPIRPPMTHGHGPQHANVRRRSAESFLPVATRVVWALIGAAVVITLALNFYPAWMRLTAMRRDLAKQKEHLEALKKETQDHEREVGLLQSDPQYLEMIARDKLDLMKDGEKIFRFPTNQQTQDQKSR